MIYVFVKSQQPEKAKQLFHEMQTKGFQPDAQTYNTLINSCGGEDRFEKALQLLQDMQCRGIAPGACTYNTLISMCFKTDPERVDELFDEMQRKDIRPDVTYNTLISACEKSVQFGKALHFFEQ